MAAFNFFNSFTEKLSEKVHNLGSDTLKLALCAAGTPPVAGNTVLANLTQVSYANLTPASAPGVTVSSSSQTGGTYTLVCADVTLAPTGGALATWRYAVLYNDTATNDELIGWWDAGVNITVAEDATHILDLGTVLTLTPA